MHLAKSLKRNLQRLLPSTAKPNTAFRGKKLSTYFQIKNQTKFEHKHIFYFGTFPEYNIDESTHQIFERTERDYNGRDEK